MGFFSWLFGTETSSSKRTEDALRAYREQEARRAEELKAVCAPDEELVRAMNRQLEPCSDPSLVGRAGSDRLQTVRNGVQGLLDEILERERKKLEEAARRRAGGDSDVRFSTTCFSLRMPPPSYAEIMRTVSQNKSLGRLLVKYVNERCEGHASWCYQRAGVSRQLYSQIISNPDKHVFKRTVMQLSLGLKLNKGEADAFLAAAGYAFSPSSYEDQVFASCLSCGVYSLFDVNELLVSGGCAPIAIN